MARQWDERSKTEEALLSGTGVNGLVFSSFRFDNPKTVARGDLDYIVNKHYLQSTNVTGFPIFR